jgi:hypothetical protein
VKLKLSLTEIALSLGGTAALIWGAWVTQELVSRPKTGIVKVNLAGLVQDYMVAASHSNWTQDQIKTQTQAFTSAVDEEIGRISADGTTVLMTEAVLSKSVHDATPEIRDAVQKRVAWPVANPNAVPLQPRADSHTPPTDIGAGGPALPEGSSNAHP